MSSIIRILAPGGAFVALALAAPAMGQPGANPADPAASVPTIQYQSALGDYRKPQFEQKLDWRQANDAARDLGGHVGAMRDAPPPADRSHTAAPAAPAAGPATGGHAGHRQ